MNGSTPPPPHWHRAARPLLWWLIMVLVMFSYRTHQRLSATTRLTFNVVMDGNPISSEATPRLDGHPIRNGERVSIGWYTFVLSHPKTKTFAKDLWVWYGENELGEIALERAKGTLAITAMPAADRLVIRGPDFSIALTNSLGFTSTVPTDRYVVEAFGQYWSRTAELMVTDNGTAAQSIVPRLGALNISASHEDVIYMLRNENRELLDSGGLPTLLNGIPEGTYLLDARRTGDQQVTRITLKPGVTNQARIEFVYGTVKISSDPPGATIRCNGQVVGVTPATLRDFKTGEVNFTLHLDDYNEAAGKLVVTHAQTNSFHTNLISSRYTLAMARARLFFEQGEYDRAVDAAKEALQNKAEDESATRLEREATGLARLQQGKNLGQRGEYAEAITTLNAAMPFLNNPAEAKSLLAGFTNLEADRVAAVKRRETELAEEERVRRKAKNTAIMRGLRLTLLKDIFADWCQKLPNHQVYAEHELVATNAIKAIATPINNALGTGLPKFEIIKYEWSDDSIFILVASQNVAGGTRMCLLVASEVQPYETHIQFKVFEYNNPPDLKLLGSLIRVNAQVSTAPPSAAEAQSFATRVKDGIKMVRDRIRAGAGLSVSTN